MQSFMRKLKVGFSGTKAMKSWDEIEAEREALKKRLTDSQINEINARLQDYNAQLSKIVTSQLSPADLTVCSLLGILTAVSAYMLDFNGKNIEAFLDSKSIKDPCTGKVVEIKDYDTNNAFDIKRGANHREQLFHSGNIWKKAPADFVMPDGFSIEELIGKGKTDYMLIEIISAKYGLNGSILKQVADVLKIMGVHFLKDIVTPAGLPLPFSDIFTKFIPTPTNACGYSTKNTLYDGFLKETNKELRMLNIRASDVTSYALIKIFCTTYVKIVYKELNKAEQKSLENKMIIATSGFLMVSQLLVLCAGKVNNVGSMVNGGKINPLVATATLKGCISVFYEANQNHQVIMDVYRQKKDFILEVSLNGNYAN